MRATKIAFIILSIFACAARGADVARSSDPLPPERSISAMHLGPGFEIELVASEPLISSPVAIDWGADGKLWVVEMYDYPQGLSGQGKPGGRVRVLEDPNGDGHYTKSTIFLDHLNMPTGIVTWCKGVIITAAPDIIYAEDTDGDDKADMKTVLYTGFKPGNPQLRVNGLRWGLDGWLYCANGWSGGHPKSLKTGQSIDLDGRDLRIKPDEGLIEAVSGQSEFGRERDDWGNWFGCDNSHPLFHFVLDEQYLRRNPHLAAPDPRVQVIVPANPRVYPVSKPQKRYYTDAAGHFTSACGMTIYRDDLLFPFGDEQHVFVCEPANNLVHHEMVRESGYTFTASRPGDEQDREFLASEDQWFRPVMARTGPDGALWIVDMYRYMIEHPDWLPEQGKRELAPFYREGENRGRIYRMFPKGKRPRPIPKLDKLSTPDLVHAMDSSNGWTRDEAHKLLAWKQDESAVQPLERLTREAQNPRVRIQALHTLFQIGEKSPDVLRAALSDPDVHFRREAIRLAEHYGQPDLLGLALRLASDANPSIQLQLAWSLGEMQQPEAGAALAKLTVAGETDPYRVAAGLSSAGHHFRAIVNAIDASDDPLTQPLHGQAVRMAIAMGDRESLATLLRPALASASRSDATERFVAVRLFLEDLASQSSSLHQWDGSDPLGDELKRIPDVLESTRRIARDPSRPSAERAAAVGLFGRMHSDEELAILSDLLGPKVAPDIRSAAASALGRMNDPNVPQVLLKDWAAHPPSLRGTILDILTRRDDWSEALLHEIDRGIVGKTEIDAARRQRLLQHGSARVRELAKRILGEGPDPARQHVIDQYREALSLKTDARHGAVVFQQNCAVCHRKGGVGADIGPNLDSVISWQSDALLTAILDPSRQVEPQYLAYTATLADGDAVYGIITSESANSITMKGLDAKQRVLLRANIMSLVGTNRSLMPDGLESAIDQQAMADVIGFLQSSP